MLQLTFIQESKESKASAESLEAALPFPLPAAPICALNAADQPPKRILLVMMLAAAGACQFSFCGEVFSASFALQVTSTWSVRNLCL